MEDLCSRPIAARDEEKTPANVPGLSYWTHLRQISGDVLGISAQPHHFQIAASLTLQPPARLDSVEIAVNVQLEHRRRMIPGSAGRCRIDAIEPKVAELECIDEHI